MRLGTGPHGECHEFRWAGSIIAFALLTAAVVGAGTRKHGSMRALLPALAGAALLTYTMLIDYHVVTEIIGFALLATAAVVDYRLRRWAPVTGGKHRARQRAAAVEKRATA